MRSELKSLTAARGIAAWLVVLYHMRASLPWLPPFWQALAAKGYLAVDFFFLLSGFVIYLSAHGALVKEGAGAVPAFLGRRFARIYPLYGFILASTVAFALVLHLTGRDDSGYPWAELPLHIAMMQNWGLTDALSWNHPAWSISAESAAYLLFPALILWTPISRTGRTGLLIGMVAMLLFLLLWLRFDGQETLGGDIARHGLARCLTEFACGAMLCAFWLKGAAYERHAMLFAGGAAMILWSLWLSGVASEIWAFPAGAACLILMLAHASALPHNPLHARVLVYLGTISYATYLAHYMAWIVFKILFIEDAAAVGPSLAAAFLLLMLPLSMLLYHGIERPGRSWLSRPMPRWRRAVAGRD